MPRRRISLVVVVVGDVNGGSRFIYSYFVTTVCPKGAIKYLARRIYRCVFAVPEAGRRRRRQVDS